MDKPTTGGRRFWRGLEERLDSPEFREMLRRHFPHDADGWLDPPTRRRFLTLLGASLGLAGLAGCNSHPPRETIVPYVRPPENLIPGRPQFYATAMPLAGFAVGLLVESHEGRPTKVEGNPDHPASLGATDVFSQASVLGLYDPDRSQTPIKNGEIRSWADAQDELRREFRRLAGQKGRGLRVLTETVASPTLAAQLDKLMTDFPEARWIEYEPARIDPDVEGAQLAFGRPLQARYEFSKADVIVGLDADFLSCVGGSLKYVRDFADRRRIAAGLPPEKMNRLYAVESSPNSVGAVADHRLRLRASEVVDVARMLANKLKVEGARGAPPTEASRDRWAEIAAADLGKNRGRSIVVAGAGQPPAVHALTYAINDALGNIGQTVLFAEPPQTKARRGLAALKELAGELESGGVKALLILSGNPVYNTPADVRFAAGIAARRKADEEKAEAAKSKADKEKAEAERLLIVHLGLYYDETAAKANWHIPEAHYLESWGDARAFDGTVSVIQPLIAPLYGGRSASELISAIADVAPRTGHDIVRDHWKEQRKGQDDFERFWHKSLNDGFIEGSQAAAVTPKRDSRQAPVVDEAPIPQKGAYEVIFRLDPTVFDGRFANNGWLQELPKPLSRLTWDNAALVGPETATDLGVDPQPGYHGGAHGETLTQVVEISFGDSRTIKAPLFVMPDHPEGSVTIHFGYGRWRAGKTAEDNAGKDANAYKLWTTAHPYFEAGATMRRLDEPYTLACVQFHHTMNAGGLTEHKLPADYSAIRSDTLDEYKDKMAKGEYWKERRQGLLPEDDDLSAEELQQRGQPRRELPLIELPPFHDKGWGMAIDLNACVGCGACVVACQAENNIPVVGKEQVTRGREMHWLRIDRYYEGDDQHVGRAYFQPVPCMHCETAPCEQVCPVEATVHSPDGLNDMVYNRCVGTRYCSNNCPYKVRRFNFLFFADWTTPSLKLQRNPDVTVRSRGVMEKCTYCVQRIREAEIQSQNTGRPLKDGDVLTACQAACPAGAIVFGNINDPQSRVMRLKNSPLNYGLMAELNTRPRTTYVTAIRNPNPDLPEA